MIRIGRQNWTVLPPDWVEGLMKHQKDIVDDHNDHQSSLQQISIDFAAHFAPLVLMEV